MKVKTNVPALDNMLRGGLVPGLHCVTGGPSSYKTAMLLQLAYLAALDGAAVEYISDEIGIAEIYARLITRKMYVESLRQLTEPCGDYAWSEIGELFAMASEGQPAPYDDVFPDVSDEEGFLSLLNAAIDDIREVVRDDVLGNAHKVLHVSEMGGRLEDDWSHHDTFEFLFGAHDRYFTSVRRMCAELARDDGNNIFDDKLHGNADLIIIDPVNSLRTCEWQGYSEMVRDNTPESKRALMEEIVDDLDNWGRSTNTAIVGVFHGPRDGKYPNHPSMQDFKESSRVEYRAVSAWKLVRADDMRWSGHPKPPRLAEGMEAVGLFLLKSRTGLRTEPNKPIWMAADGAHNLLMPL